MNPFMASHVNPGVPDGPVGGDVDPARPEPVEADGNGPKPEPENSEPGQPEPGGAKPANSATGDPAPPTPDVPAAGDRTDRHSGGRKEQVALSEGEKAAAYATADALLTNKRIWRNLDAVGQQMQEATQLQERELKYTVGTAEGVTVVTLAGCVVWFVRAGPLLASILSTMPIWRSFDPLPILDTSETKKRMKRRRMHPRDDEIHDDEKELSMLVGGERP